ncbi:hypothetical protein OE88DRAFT_1649301 [Heliocybe sulcata]|uniref:Uncharacterized protein n=1 Tax=Heliocybe sulcata TaxID=5364 RepID=A0A5C3MJ60_9AGAM|nr:hypothetical protein OE88DRAFT_1649301 [Heliocybe sulcata]
MSVLQSRAIFRASLLHFQIVMSPAQDLSVVELSGAAFEWLGPGGRITIGDVKYEYADSDNDDSSIDDAVGPGRTFGRLVKRVAAPLEMFLSLCSDLLGNGPDATYTRLIRRSRPWGKETGDYRCTRHLGWWFKQPFMLFEIMSASSHPRDETERLVQFTIDRRYNLSVRLTAAYYLSLLVLSLPPDEHCHTLPLVHDALLRLCQEASRRGISPTIMRPLEELVVFKEDLICIASCPPEDVPAVIMDSSWTMVSPLVHYYSTFRLQDVPIRIHTRSELEAFEQAMEAIRSNPYYFQPDIDPLTSAVKSEARQRYNVIAYSLDNKRRLIEINEFIEHMELRSTGDEVRSPTSSVKETNLVQLPQEGNRRSTPVRKPELNAAMKGVVSLSRDWYVARGYCPCGRKPIRGGERPSDATQQRVADPLSSVVRLGTSGHVQLEYEGYDGRGHSQEGSTKVACKSDRVGDGTLYGGRIMTLLRVLSLRRKSIYRVDAEQCRSSHDNAEKLWELKL